MGFIGVKNGIRLIKNIQQFFKLSLLSTVVRFGKVEKCILRQLWYKFKTEGPTKYDYSFDIKILIHPSIRDTEVSADDCIMAYYELKNDDDLFDLPIAKKQTVYNAITRLQDKGYITKSMRTCSNEWDAPPTNYLIIKARINKDGKIANFKNNTNEVLKNLIGE